MKVESEGGVLIISPPGEEPYELDFCGVDVGDDLRRNLMDIVMARVGPTGKWRKLTAQGGLWSLRTLFEGLGVTGAGEITYGKYLERLMSLPQGTRYTHHMRLRKVVQEIRGVDPEEKSRIINHRVPRPARDSSRHVVTEQEFVDLRRLCFESVQSALRRVKAGWAVVDSYRNGEYAEGTADWEYGTVLDEIARTGTLATRDPSNSGRILLPVSVRQRLYPGQSIARVSAFPLWSHLYPTSDETCAAVTGLIATCGWNATTLLRLHMTNITRVDPQDGTQAAEFHVLLDKPRLGPVSQWGENLHDGDWDEGEGDDAPESIDARFEVRGDKHSKGRLLTMVIELTEGGRRTLAAAGRPCDNLIIGLTDGLHRGSRTTTELPIHPWATYDVAYFPMASWRKSTGHVWATPRALRHYFVVHVHPEGHVASMNLEYSLTDPTMKQLVQPSIAEVLESQFDGMMATVVTEDADIASQAPQVVARGVREDVESGQLDTLGSSCLDHDHNPETHAPCRVSFLDCFACKNAVVLKRHLPRNIAIYERLEFLRSYTPDAGWNRVYAIYHARVSSVLERYSQDDVEQAREVITDDDRDLVATLIKDRWNDDE